MVKNHLKHSRIRIQIFTKIESIISRYIPNLSIKFNLNPSTTFLRYPATCRFWPYLSMVKSHLKKYSQIQIQIRIQIFTKIRNWTRLVPLLYISYSSLPQNKPSKQTKRFEKYRGTNAKHPNKIISKHTLPSSAPKRERAKNQMPSIIIHNKTQCYYH